MEYDQHVSAIRRESDALVSALRAGPIDAPVPSCPDWTLADLAGHVGEFMGFWTHVLCEGTHRPKTKFNDRPEPGALADWCSDLAGQLVDTLRTTPPDTEVWTWVKTDQSARFVARRAANELAVHRFDAQLACKRPEPIETALAADGIDEIFVMMANRGREINGKGETIHLHSTDSDHEWLITIDSDSVSATHEHAKADLALRGALSDIELVLFQRPPLRPVEHIGDETALDSFHRAFTF